MISSLYYLNQKHLIFEFKLKNSFNHNLMRIQLIKKNWPKYSIFTASVLTGLWYGRKSNDRHIRMGLAGLLGQITTDLIFHPLDVVNTRTKFLFSEKLNIRQMARRIYNNSGIFGIFRGGSVMLWGASFSGFVYF